LAGLNDWVARYPGLRCGFCEGEGITVQDSLRTNRRNCSTEMTRQGVRPGENSQDQRRVEELRCSTYARHYERKQERAEKGCVFVFLIERNQKHPGADSQTFTSLIHYHHHHSNNNTSLHRPHRRLPFHQPSRRHRTRWLTWLAPIRQSHHYRNSKVLGSIPIKTRKTERND
jgi:hypothetical protein